VDVEDIGIWLVCGVEEVIGNTISDHRLPA
jgi:hypothetical protein